MMGPCARLLGLALHLLVALCVPAAAFVVAPAATKELKQSAIVSLPPSSLRPRTRSSTTRLHVFERMTEGCVNAIVAAQTTATRLMLETVDEGCMLVGCVDRPESKALERTFQQYRIKYRTVSTALERRAKDDTGDVDSDSKTKWLAGFRAAATNDNDRPFSPALKRRFKGAARLADQMESKQILTHHLFLSLLGYREVPNSSQSPVALADAIEEKDEEGSSALSKGDRYEAWELLRTVLPQDGTVTALQVCESLLSNLKEQGAKGAARGGGGPELVTGGGIDASKTPTLAEVGTDLTQLAKDGLLDPVFARDSEIRSCVRTLLRRRKNNVVLLGEPGTGKTAIAEGVAQLLVSDMCPPKLQGHRLVSLELSSLVAGTKYRGEFEERLQSVLEEVLDPKAPPTILFIDEIHNLVGAGAAEGGMDAANLLKPALARGEMQLIGATTISEYRKYIEKDGALERRLQPVVVREPTFDQTVGILKALQSNYQQHHGVTYTHAALYAAASLSERYVTDRFLPDKAIDLMDEAGAIAQLERDDDNNDDVPAVDEHVVARVVSELTGIPLGKLESTEMDRLQALESELEARVKGQRRAVRGVARAIRRARSGLRDPKRPVASFLLCGGTGTGKTELCKTLAQTYYGSEKDMIRIDMSEYMDKHTVSRLVGAPPGFIGYDEGGQLTEKVRKKPHSVVLLDEIEKAHEDVLNILLQILEDGVLTDGKGRTVNFKNTILVMTSNVGSRRILELTRDAASASRLSESLPSKRVNGGTASSIPEPPNAMSPEAALKRLQNSPQAASLMLKASSDPEIMDAIRRAMNGSPADLLEAAQKNSVVADFLQELWSSLDTAPETGERSAPSSGLDSIRSSVKDTVSNWSDDDKINFFSGVGREISSPHDDHVLYPRLAEVVKEELEAKMKPELLNRIDEIVVFSPLRKRELIQIASLTVNRILDRASHEQELQLTVDESIVNEIVREGSAKADQFGARPMRRAAQRFVEDTLSDAVVQGFLRKGDQATLTLSNVSSAVSKKQVVVSRQRDRQQLVVEVEDASGGIDGVLSPSHGATGSVNANAAAETSALRS